VGEEVEVPASRVRVHAKCSSEVCGVPQLCVAMCQGAPEAPQGGRCHLNTPLGEVAFEKGSNEVAAPLETGGVGSGKVRARQATAQPQPGRRGWPKLGQVESADFDAPHPTSEALRALTKQVAARASQNQKAGPIPAPINEHA